MRRHRHGFRVRKRLQKRIFVWFGVSILSTGLVVLLLTWLVFPQGAAWREDFERAQRFVGNRFAALWDDPAARDELARTTADELAVGIVLLDHRGDELERFGIGCPDGCHRFTAEVTRSGAHVGRVVICKVHPGAPRGGVVVFGALLVAGLMLWAASGALARRLLKPLGQVVRVAQDIGDGRMQSRVRLRRHRDGEVEVLATAINEMADRIQKQLSDQRELLAAVSHEIRTPLGHMRVLLELARDRGADAETMNELEREVLAVESLVRQLLASSRLDFDAIEERDVDAVELARRALERAGVGADALVTDTDDATLRGDPTLIASALANLIDNAQRHGGGVTSLRVSADDDGVTFEVADAGPGFDPAERERVFDSFFRGERRAGGSLGLGLALVRRIALAHGGRAWTVDGDGPGARVALRVARRRPSP